MADVFFQILIKAIRLAVLLPAVLAILGFMADRSAFRALALAIWVGAALGALAATILWAFG